MYSVVLLMAVTAGSQSPDYYHGCYGCGGCYAVSYCHGCYGCHAVSYCHGCVGCYGCHAVSYCHGCYGCHAVSYCHGCYGCHAISYCHGCYGCHAVSYCHGCHGCHGVIIHGCHGCHGCTGCCGGGKIVPDGKMEKGGKGGKGGKPGEDDLISAAPATLVVSLPADARLIIDGEATTSTTARRTFVSPELAPGKTYSYNLWPCTSRTARRRKSPRPCKSGLAEPRTSI